MSVPEREPSPLCCLWVLVIIVLTALFLNLALSGHIP
jgi:hypothetical protein